MEFKRLPAGIRSQFLQLFHSPEMIGWDNGYESGRFDARRAARVATGNSAVFKRRWEVDEIRSAVVILIDLSGSMSTECGDGKGRARVAFELAYAMSETLDAAGVTNEVYGFCTGSQNSIGGMFAGDSLKGNEQPDWVSAGTARLLRCKRTNDRAVNKQTSFNTLANRAGGGTPDYAAVRGVLEIMARDKSAQQKVALILTDGDGDAKADGLLALSKQAERNGILLAGIGIGYDVSSVYPVSARCDSVEQLNASVIKTLKDAASRTQAARTAAMKAGG
jgi:hypothetical protein